MSVVGLGLGMGMVGDGGVGGGGAGVGVGVGGGGVGVGAGAAARDSVSAVETTLSAAAVVDEVPVASANTIVEVSGAIMMTAILPREKDLISKKGIRDKYTWASYHLGKLCQKKACIKAYFEYTICTFVF